MITKFRLIKQTNIGHSYWLLLFLCRFVVRSLTWSQRLHCVDNSQRFCGTPSPLFPSWAPFRFWGRRSIVSPGPAPLSGSTSAPRHCPPEWTVVMAPSSLVTRSQERIKNKFQPGSLGWQVRSTRIHNTVLCTTPRTPPCPGGMSVTVIPRSWFSLPEINYEWHDLPADSHLCMSERYGSLKKERLRWHRWALMEKHQHRPGYDQNKPTKIWSLPELELKSMKNKAVLVPRFM